MKELETWLTPIDTYYKQKRYGRVKYVKCVCKCGNIKEISYTNYKNGNTRSCGCYSKFKLKDKYGYKNRKQGCLNIINIGGEVYYPLFEFYGYYVNTNGNVYSAKTDKILKQDTSKKGYRSVGLYNNIGRATRQRVHRIVASVFIINNHNLPQVNHKDGDKENNHASNLEWCTSQYNSKHAWDTGLNKPRRGEKSSVNKLSEKEVVEIYKSNKTTKELSEIFNISPRTIRDIKRDKTWTDTTKNLKKGKQPENKKFSEPDIVHIYTSDETSKNLSILYDCPEPTIKSILSGKSYKDVTRNLKKGKNPNRLTKEEVEYIYLTKYTYKELKNKINVSEPVVSSIRNNKSYTKITKYLQGKSEEDIEREYEISQEAGDDYIGGL
ncbi:HNH endonuclease protein [Staphylococcus phage vB_SurM-PSU4]|nr:HNH endonuclease protein [Staphylococcus phage vB_SurM-PSU4]